jgi:hypothetical protein
MAQSMRVATQKRNTAKKRFSFLTGREWANFTPRGAVQ